MTRLDAATLSSILIEAPAWARVGLTMPDPRMRERAADCLAATILDRLNQPAPTDPDQMALPIG
jgi:hypothetical protein